MYQCGATIFLVVANLRNPTGQGDASLILITTCRHPTLRCRHGAFGRARALYNAAGDSVSQCQATALLMQRATIESDGVFHGLTALARTGVARICQVQ